MPSYRDIIMGNPQLGLPRGLVPRLQAAAHGWQRRGGAPAADVGSLPLNRAPTRAEIAASTNVQQEADAAARPNIMELLLGKLGPSRTMFLGARALHAPVDRIGKAMEAMQAGEAPRDVYKTTGITRGAEGAPRFEVSDAAARIRGQEFDDLYDTEAVSGQLGELLKHPELLSNYPELEKYATVLRKGPRGGNFNPATNTIEAAGQSREEVLNSLLHELQHGVQNLEGHARGGSKRIAKSMTSSNDPTELRRIYRNLAGEVESRNTQARQGMGAAQRAASFPEDTEDVERALQIIRRSPNLQKDRGIMEMANESSKYGGYSPFNTPLKSGQFVKEGGAYTHWKQDHQELVKDALHGWKGSPTDMHLQIRDIASGGSIKLPQSNGTHKQRAAQAAALLWELDNKSKTVPVNLYRGASQFGKGNVTGWSESKTVANKFAKQNNGKVEVLPKNTAKGLRINDYVGGEFSVEKEWLIK